MFDDDPDVFAEIFRTGTELLHHPQTSTTARSIAVDDPALGAVTQPGPLVAMDATPASIDRVGAALDEHGAELRARARRARSPRATDDGPPIRRWPASRSSSSARSTPLRSARRSSPTSARASSRSSSSTATRCAGSCRSPRLAAIKVLQGKESVAVDIAQRRRSRDRLRARPPRRRGAAVVPRRCRRPARCTTTRPCSREPRPRVPQRARLRRRRAVRPPSGVRADDRRGRRAGEAQRRRVDPRTDPTSRSTRSSDHSLRLDDARDGRRARRRLLRARRRHRARSRSLRAPARCARTVDAHHDAEHHGPRDLRRHGRVRRSRRSARPRPGALRTAARLPPLRDRRRLGVPRRAVRTRSGPPW